MPFKKGQPRPPRKSTRISLSVADTPTPRNTALADEDDEMPDAAATPPPPLPVNADEEDYGIATPANANDEDEDEDEEDEPEQDAESPPTITALPRRRGRGGRPRTRIDTPEQDGGSEAGTPFRRRRGRPPGSTTGSGRGRGGFRGRRRGQAPEPPRVIIDKDGSTLDVVDDEATVDDDPEGNEKVDSKGNLLGGREYRVRTFTIIGKDERLYMLSTEPARCCGFRDSYLFFTKHPKLYKVVIGEDEKKDLIERDVLPNSYKGRNIGVVTARSVFREFGAKIIVGGRRVVDDYKVAEARANGELEGELVDPDDKLPAEGEEYNRNRYVAWFGASEVYRSQGTGTALPVGKQGPLGRKRNNITLENWQTVHAKEASRFNSSLTALRQANLAGVYEPHTNMMFYPKIMQPTHARWEEIPPNSTSPEQPQPFLTNGTTPNGHHHHHHNNNNNNHHQPDETPLAKPTIFAPIPPVISRNFIVVDTQFSAPPISNIGFPGPDGEVEDPSSGSIGLSTVTQDLIDELPDDCRAAFESARDAEMSWKQGWGTEAYSGHRGQLRIGLSGYPV